MDKFFIIVDGSNVAFSKRTQQEQARYQNLEILIKRLLYLKSIFPIEYEITVDATLRHRIDEEEKLETAIRSGVINQCPSKVKADTIILEYFKKYPERLIIISNDNFNEYSIPSLPLIKFDIIFNDIIFIPNLEEFLRTKFQVEKGEGKCMI